MERNNIKRFIIRVYGLIINEKNEVLLSDEFQLNTRMTKFPGGGLEFGEGPVDCLKREAIEELNQDVEIMEHFYTTDFFQKALFYDDAQLISIYYLARFILPVKFHVSEKPFEFEEKNGNQSFRWQALNDLKPGELTFPIDKHVAGMLRGRFTLPSSG